MGASDIFGTDQRYTVYEGGYHLFSLVGGIPKDPDTIAKFIAAKVEADDYVIRRIVDETMAEMGLTADNATSEQMRGVLDSVARQQAQGNGFKSWRGELIWESRCLKAAICEAANVLYPGVEQWPGYPGAKITRKGFSGYAKERFSIHGQDPSGRYLLLGRSRPDVEGRVGLLGDEGEALIQADVEGEQRIKHVTGPQGKRSVITVVDVCEDIEIHFQVRVLDDFIRSEVWGQIWSYVENEGVGADRARDDGRGELLYWRQVDQPEAKKIHKH